MLKAGRTGRTFMQSLLLAVLILAVTPGMVPALTYEADRLPWSGWWWPFTTGGIVTGTGYKGHPAPLEKYDIVMTGLTQGPATQYGLKNYYKPSAKGWEGLCFFWAAASMLEEEPVNRGIYEDTLFNVGDKKGLLTAAYDGVRFRRYDIERPEHFQDILEQFIRNQRAMIMFDLGSDGEIWNYPVYKYDIGYTEDGNTRHYTVKLYYATDTVSPDYVGLRTSEKTFNYFYQMEGNAIVRSGWEGRSASAPPGDAADPYGTLCLNPGLDYETVKKIAYTDDDPFEPNNGFAEAAVVTSGRHRLIAADDDYFKVRLTTGDRLKLRAEMESSNAVDVRIYDPSKAQVGQVCDGCTVSTRVLMPGDYYIEIIPRDPETQPYYELYLEHELLHRAIFPYDPGGAWAGGLTLLASDGGMGRVILCQLDETGAPIRGYGADLETAFLEGSLQALGLDRSTGGYIRVDSDRPLAGLYATSDGSGYMAGANFMPQTLATSNLVFPHVAAVAGWSTWLGFINVGEAEEDFDITVYDAAGKVLATEHWVLEPGEKYEDDRFTGLFPSRGTTMTMTARSGRDVLVGYLRYLAPLPACPATAVVRAGEISDGFFVPHIASSADWWTGIAVMNAGPSAADVAFTAYDASGGRLGTVVRTLNPNQNLVSMATRLFPPSYAGRIASLEIDGGLGSELSGLVVYGSADGQVLSGNPMERPRAGAAYVPQVLSAPLWWEGLAAVHQGDGATAVHFDLMDDGGSVVRRASRVLNPHERFLGMAESLFGNSWPDDARYLRISAGQAPLSGLYLQGSSDGKRLSGDGLAPIGP